MIHVRAVNGGHRPVELRGLYFRGLDGSVARPHMFADDLPKMIHDGESFDAYTDEFKINEAANAAEVRPTHVAVSDAEGNEYTAPCPSVEFGQPWTYPAERVCRRSFRPTASYGFPTGSASRSYGFPTDMPTKAREYGRNGRRRSPVFSGDFARVC